MDNWKKIEGYENYVINEDGVVKNMRILKNGQPRNGILKWTLLEDRNTYIVNLKNDGGRARVHYIHKLLAKAFIPNPNNLPDVVFVDHNTHNLSLNNIRWGNRNTITGIKNVYMWKQKHGDTYQYVFIKVIKKRKIRKYFESLAEAIKYKEEFEEL